MFSYVDLEKRVHKNHPPRPIREMADTALTVLSGAFAALYSGMGRPWIAPGKLPRAMLLRAFYSIRSERQPMERLEFDLLFRWFVGLGIDDPVWDHSTFSKNRDRLLDGDIAVKFLATVLAQLRVKRLLSTNPGRSWRPDGSARFSSIGGANTRPTMDAYGGTYWPSSAKSPAYPSVHPSLAPKRPSKPSVTPVSRPFNWRPVSWTAATRRRSSRKSSTARTNVRESSSAVSFFRGYRRFQNRPVSPSLDGLMTRWRSRNS
jgi:transposase